MPLLRVSTNDESSVFTGELNIDYWLIVALATAVAAFSSLSWPKRTVERSPQPTRRKAPEATANSSTPKATDQI
jgi:hypothetical protein